MEFEAVLEAVRAWPIEDRARLIDVIQEDLVGHDPDLTPELKEELDRRIAEVRANPGDGIPWEQVLAEARTRFRR